MRPDSVQTVAVRRASPQRRRRGPRSTASEACSSSSIHMWNDAIVGSETDPVFSHVRGSRNRNDKFSFRSWLERWRFNWRASARQIPSLLVKKEENGREVVHGGSPWRISDDTADRDAVAGALVTERDELERLVGGLRLSWTSRLSRRRLVSRHAGKDGKSGGGGENRQK